MKQKHMPAWSLALGGLFCALFFLSSNILPPIQIIPGVPVTFQVLVIALAAGLLGCKFSFTVLAAVFLMTAAGVPMMSGFSGGLAAFVKPTTGYMIGWFFIVLTVGLYRDLVLPRLKGKGRGAAVQCGGFLLSGGAGALFCYACGAAWLSVYSGAGLSAFWLGFVGNAVFFPFDLLKFAAAFFLSRAMERLLVRAGYGLAR